MTVVFRASLACTIALFVATQATSAQPQTLARAAVVRALPLLQRSAKTFVAQRTCISCHHNSLAIMALRLVQERGFTVDAKTLDDVETVTFRELRGPRALDNAIQAITLADPTPNESLLLMAAHAAGVPRDLTTAVYARRMAKWQRDGHWVTSDFRPPHSSSIFTATATAIRAIQAYMPEERADERDATVQRARQWLIATKGGSTEDAAFRLLGLVWAGATANERADARRDLLARQQPGGGFAQLPGYQPDAYSTGEALFALHEAGDPPTDAAWQKGAAFLISSQAADGSWRVRTRMISPASISPPYFSTGFPYAKDEFLSYAGSCWAVMALAASMPAAQKTATPTVAGADVDTPRWVRTALFGNARELEGLLVSGVDASSQTGGGSTMLMMAAPEDDKVRVLLARDAQVKQRSPAGVDALTLAAAQFGTSASIARLLDAGAEIRPPEGVRVRRSPLVLAAMTGDVAAIKLLLTRGAEPSSEALSEAVTFGHAEVVRALIEAGADARITESSGVNLLHWATITNRASVIPILVRAGVPLNATDDNGFTPLMYAATVDVGDTDTLKALLSSGADRKIRNDQGRTALDQARHYKHARIADALR
ncbi:MAG TPA: ankyrin repeat domain-containing protein [Vicinamibacterales bacterium]